MSLLQDITHALFRYLRGQFLIVLILMVLYAVGFFLVGVPFWWLAALLCGPLHLMPFFGPAIGAVIPVILVLIGGKGFWDVIEALIVVGLVQLVETLFLTPTIMGKELRLHPLAVFVIVIAGAFLFGPVGALLAAPAAAIALLIWRRIREPENQRKE